MELWTPLIGSVLCSLIASSGMWAYISSKECGKNAQNELLIGLAHDRIVYLGMAYITRGYVTQDEYENLYEYLFVPYKKLGGNGSAEKIMNEVNRLELRPR